MLANLKFSKLANEPWSKDDTNEQGRKACKRSAERNESDYTKRADRREQFFEEQPIKHFHLPLETFQGFLYLSTAGTFEQDCVSFLSDLPQKVAGVCGILKKVRGIGRQASQHGLSNHVAGRAAYSNEHINPAFRGVASHVAVQRLSPTAEFEHLAQHGDAPPGWSYPENVEHCPGRFRIRVIAIV
jgi:hypothetical protein